MIRKGEKSMFESNIETLHFIKFNTINYKLYNIPKHDFKRNIIHIHLFENTFNIIDFIICKT